MARRTKRSAAEMSGDALKTPSQTAQREGNGPSEVPTTPHFPLLGVRAPVTPTPSKKRKASSRKQSIGAESQSSFGDTPRARRTVQASQAQLPLQFPQLPPQQPQLPQAQFQPALQYPQFPQYGQWGQPPQMGQFSQAGHLPQPGLGGFGLHQHQQNVPDIGRWVFVPTWCQHCYNFQKFHCVTCAPNAGMGPAPQVPGSFWGQVHDPNAVGLGGPSFPINDGGMATGNLNVGVQGQMGPNYYNPSGPQSYSQAFAQSIQPSAGLGPSAFQGQEPAWNPSSWADPNRDQTLAGRISDHMNTVGQEPAQNEMQTAISQPVAQLSVNTAENAETAEESAQPLPVAEFAASRQELEVGAPPALASSIQSALDRVEAIRASGSEPQWTSGYTGLLPRAPDAENDDDRSDAEGYEV